MKQKIPYALLEKIKSLIIKKEIHTKIYIIIKTNSSFDSIKKRSSNALKNVNITACSSLKKEKIEINRINKIRTKNEYEQEIEFPDNSEKNHPK